MKINCVKIAFPAVLFSGLLGLARAASAAIILSPNDVEVVIQGDPYQDMNFTATNFSTYGNPLQRTIVGTSNGAFLAALQSALGPAPGYQINSATLTVGSDADDYSNDEDPSEVTAHVLLVSYDPIQVTWNSRATGTPWNTAGLSAGIDYASADASTGSATPGHTTTESDFTGLGPVVQNWIDGTTPNFGLFFLASLAVDSTTEYTAYTNVVWTIDATALPEPASLSLLACGGVLLLRRRVHG